MYRKAPHEQEKPPEHGCPDKLALSMKESEQATGLGHVRHNEEVQTGRLRTYRVGRRRFTTHEWIREWQADRAAETQKVTA